jgi:hypothetical protein
MITSKEAYHKLTVNRLANLEDPYEIQLSLDIKQSIYDMIDAGTISGTEIKLGRLSRKKLDSVESVIYRYKELGYTVYAQNNLNDFDEWILHIHIAN